MLEKQQMLLIVSAKMLDLKQFSAPSSAHPPDSPRGFQRGRPISRPFDAARASDHGRRLSNGERTAAEIHAEMPDPPSYSAVRAALRVLEQKGHLRHERRSHHYVFWPTVSRRSAQRDAARRLLTTFFEGSASGAVAALLECADDLPDEEIEELRKMIAVARREGR